MSGSQPWVLIIYPRTLSLLGSKEPPFLPNTSPASSSLSLPAVINGKPAAAQAVLSLPILTRVIFYSEPEALPIVSS